MAGLGKIIRSILKGAKGQFPKKRRRPSGLGRGLSDIPVQKSKHGLGLPKRKAPKAARKPPKAKVVEQNNTAYSRQLNTIKTVAWTVGGFGVGMGVGGAITTWQAGQRTRREARRHEANKKLLRDYGEGIRSRGITRGQAMSSAFSPPPLATYDLRKSSTLQLLKSAFNKKKRRK